MVSPNENQRRLYQAQDADLSAEFAEDEIEFIPFLARLREALEDPFLPRWYRAKYEIYSAWCSRDADPHVEAAREAIEDMRLMLRASDVDEATINLGLHPLESFLAVIEENLKVNVNNPGDNAEQGQQEVTGQAQDVMEGIASEEFGTTPVPNPEQAADQTQDVMEGVAAVDIKNTQPSSEVKHLADQEQDKMEGITIGDSQNTQATDMMDQVQGGDPIETGADDNPEVESQAPTSPLKRKRRLREVTPDELLLTPPGTGHRRVLPSRRSKSNLSDAPTSDAPPSDPSGE